MFQQFLGIQNDSAERSVKREKIRSLYETTKNQAIKKRVRINKS